MQPGRKKLQDGDFNIMSVVELPSGLQKITLYKDEEKKVYKFTVKGLYSPQEELTDYEEVDLP